MFWWMFSCFVRLAILNSSGVSSEHSIRTAAAGAALVPSGLHGRTEGVRQGASTEGLLLPYAVSAGPMSGFYAYRHAREHEESSTQKISSLATLPHPLDP